MTVRIITVGDEILIGQIIDTNSAWIAQKLHPIGAHIIEIDSVSDKPDAIRNTLKLALQDAEVVIITGGLGPTRDDVTKKTLADYFGMELYFHEPTYAWVKTLFERLGRTLDERYNHQFMMPSGALILPNKMGTAPGMLFEQQGKIVVSLPGVPYEMQYLMENSVIPWLVERFPGRTFFHRTLLTAGEGETVIATRIKDYEDALPPGFSIAYLPSLGQVRLRLNAKGASEELANSLFIELKHLLGDIVYGEEQDNLPSAVGRLLLEKGWSMATAESCTGGYLSHLITTIPGSSRYYQGSVISYSNELKTKLLNVPPDLIAKVGAVSQEVVESMVRGGILNLGVDIVIATSGIAGPDGGTPEKPVGTIWLAVGSRDKVCAKLIRGTKNREKNIEYAGIAALNLARRFMLDLPI